MNDVKQRSGASRVIIRPMAPVIAPDKRITTDKLPVPFTPLDKKGGNGGGGWLVGAVLVVLGYKLLKR